MLKTKKNVEWKRNVNLTWNTINPIGNNPDKAQAMKHSSRQLISEIILEVGSSIFYVKV